MGLLNLIAMKDKEKNGNGNTQPCVTFLTREQVDFLDRLGKDSSFKFGHKLSRTRILSELVDLMIHLGVSMEDMDLNHDTLCEGILKQLQVELGEDESK